MEGRSPIPQAQRRLKFQDKVKGQEHCDERFAGLTRTERGIIANRSYDDSKTSRNIYTHSTMGKGTDVRTHDKSRSDLPAYLEHLDKGGRVQDKALNVGVLNWDHIDKRRNNSRGVVEAPRQDASSANSNSRSSLASKLYYESHAPPSRHQAALCSNHSITSRVGFAPAVPNGERIVCLLSPRKPISDVRTVLPITERSSSRSYSHLHPTREEPKQRSTSNLKDDELYISSREKMPAGVYETKKILDMLQKSCAKNLTHTELYSEIRRTISKMQSIESPNMPRKVVEKKPNSSPELNDQLCPQRHGKTIVLLSKDGYLTPSRDSMVPESLVFRDEALGLDKNSSSDLLSCEGDSLSYCVSGPRPQDSDSGGDTCDSHPNDFHNITVLPKVSQIFSISTDLNAETSDDACAQRKEPISEHRESTLSKRSLRLDQAFLDKPTLNSRNPSPLRQISSGFSRMRRSLSSKDSSIIAPSNSKRFPRSIGVPFSPVDPLKDKADSSKKARSSPLRRLIDPILKSNYVDEHNGSTKEAKLLDYAAVSALRLKKKRDTVQALLQYSSKNGLPMFKLVAKNKGDALVATMANTSSHDKQDVSISITIYSVNEMTNSISWMYQGRKGKNLGYLYNIVGQMTLCMPSCDENADVSSGEQFSVIESTLFGVQPSKTDQETIMVKPGGELAALVIKTPKDSLKIGQKSNSGELLLKKFTDCLSEYGLVNMSGSSKKSSTIVILPAGVHSIPNKGAPSPLLHRWRPGGSCDCGGWDVGCNLNLLHEGTNKGCCEPAGESNESPLSECFQLFSQTGAHEKDPSFRLTPIKNGIYSVDFKPSTMSELQAFFISITVLSSQVVFDHKGKD